MIKPNFTHANIGLGFITGRPFNAWYKTNSRSYLITGDSSVETTLSQKLFPQVKLLKVFNELYHVN
jgi:hypothetical protein